MEQVDLLNLTFTQHMKDKRVFDVMASRRCLCSLQHGDMWLLVNDKNKKSYKVPGHPK